MPPYSLCNLEIQNYYQNEPKFKGVYSGNNLPKTMEHGVYVVRIMSTNQ